MPKPTAVKLVLGLLMLPIVALPDITDQVPTPLVGVLPANTVVGVEIHKVGFGPAIAILAAGSTWMVIVLDVLEQVPTLVMLHCKTFVPKLKLVTVEFAASELVMIPVPVITDQVPTPLVGVLPANTVVGVEIHKV